jgi:N-methylhydantoinase B
VLDEVRNGIISIEKAQEIYAVVIDPKTIEINEAETRRLRS